VIAYRGRLVVVYLQHQLGVPPGVVRVALSQNLGFGRVHAVGVPVGIRAIDEVGK
jgi:hypothetical protein